MDGWMDDIVPPTAIIAPPSFSTLVGWKCLRKQRNLVNQIKTD